MGLERIDVDGDEDHVVLGRRHLAIDHNVVVPGVVEAQVGKLVEGRIVAADPIEAGDIVANVARPVVVPGLDLVLL